MEMLTDVIIGGWTNLEWNGEVGMEEERGRVIGIWILEGEERGFGGKIGEGLRWRGGVGRRWKRFGWFLRGDGLIEGWEGFWMEKWKFSFWGDWGFCVWSGKLVLGLKWIVSLWVSIFDWGFWSVISSFIFYALK